MELTLRAGGGFAQKQEFPDDKLLVPESERRTFFVPARKPGGFAEVYNLYTAQERPQIDAAGAKKYPFRTGTK